MAKKILFRNLSRNEYLIAKGQICDKIWFVSKGLIRHYQSDFEQSERTTCFALENNFTTCFSGYLHNTPSKENLIALEQSEVIELSKVDFSYFIETIPSVNLLYRKVLEGAFTEMENVNYILQNYGALERYKRLILEESPELLKRVPLIYLASYLGISPETLSRVRAKASWYA